MMSAQFTGQNSERIRDVVARLGVADVRAFGLTWEDCEQFLQSLGYSARIEIVAGPSTRSTAVVREKPARKYGKPQ